MKYSRIYTPIFISYFFLFIILLFNINFNTNNFENINDLYKYLSSQINIIYTLIFVSIAYQLVAGFTYLLYKHINLLFFSSSLLLIILPVFFIYLKKLTFNYTILLLFFLLTYFSFFIYELLIRYYIKIKAKNIFFGSELKNISKLFFIDKKIKDDFTVVYFHIPYFYEIISKTNSLKNTATYLKTIEHIIFKNFNKYNIILINNTFNSYTYLFKKKLFFKTQDYAYQAVLSCLELQNDFNNLNINNYLLKELKPKFVICSLQNTSAFYDFKDKKYFLISEVLGSVEKLSNNFNDNNIIIDESTNKLTATYFTTKELQHNIHAVLGISTY